MTPEQFNEFCGEVIPQALFHVDYADYDDETGGRLEEVILARCIGQNVGCLKYKPLQWFFDTYLTKPHEMSDIEIDVHEAELENWENHVKEINEFRQAEVEYYENNPPISEEELFRQAEVEYYENNSPISE